MIDTAEEEARNLKTATTREEAWSPLNLLFPYQRAIVCDTARFKIVSCARQTGKSTVFACESTMDCCAHPGTHWLALSAGMRQASEWLVKAQHWAEIWCNAFSAAGSHTSLSSTSKTELRFSNGSRIVALPANPQTARGYTANLILDEFAYHEHPDDIWAAVAPSISNEISNKMKIRIGSTVAGKQNKFWKLLEGAKNNNGGSQGSVWSWHVVDVLQARADGLPVDIETLRAGIADDDIWAQEYMCQPVDAATALLTYDAIAACEDDAATDYFADAEADLAAPGKRFVIGMDIGRQHDLSVIWTAELCAGGVLRTREILELKRTPLEEQQQALFRRLSHRSVVAACIDCTGIGKQLAENAERTFGSRAVQVAFTEKSKLDLFVGLRSAFERRAILLPRGLDRLREDLHSMQRLTTSSGRVLFSAPTNADGHADRATACALAIMAAKRATGISDSAGAVDLRRPFSAGYLGGRAQATDDAPPWGTRFDKPSGTWW